jgi:aminopeptidase N
MTISSCFLLRQPALDPTDEPVEVVTIDIEERDLDTLFVEAPRPYKPNQFKLPPYNESHKRIHDLLHTKLDVRFNWEKQHLLGKATLTFKPYFYSTNQLTLDAKSFDVHQVAIIHQSDTNDLKFKYDGKQLFITLDKTYTRAQKYNIFIDYTAKPTERRVGGSSAIQSDQGLYFINHDGTIPNKPQQIWTQGETESSSCWFPTIDKPNERCTQELYITVQNKFTTLSNGLMIESKDNSDGTRTDYWKQSIAHAPYLFMMAIGEFAVVKDQWRGKEIGYYVEPAFEKDARAIYSNTLEMLDFYSDKLGIEYPWEKYSQVVVRDYVSGAMENTTGVIYGQFIQKTQRELIDNHNERILAHEMIHHWFGDYVTCESWANLTLNEGFANYGEYLWFEHKYGKDEADFHLLNELRGYLYTNKNDMHELIDFDYKDKEDMFDAHSYNKGGCVMHALRNYVGDDAFFKALNLYLTENAYTAVEGHQLRLAFEEVTGEDLNWFFNQWFYSKGHPSLSVTYDYDSLTQKAIMVVRQEQDPKVYPAIFQLPLALDIYTENGVERKNVFIKKRIQAFRFKVDAKPKLMNLDAERVLVGKMKDNKTTEDYIYQYQHAPLFKDRYDALVAITRADSLPSVQATFERGLQDAHWVIVNQAINHVQQSESVMKALHQLLSHPNSNIRVASLNKLRKFKDKSIVAHIEKAILTEQAYPVINAQIGVLREFAPEKALQAAVDLKPETHPGLVFTLAEIFAADGDLDHLQYFYDNAPRINGFYASAFFEFYAKMLFTAPQGDISKHSDLLKVVAEKDDYSWKRYHAAKAIFNVSQRLKVEDKFPKLVAQLDKKIKEIKDNETNPRIQNLYRGW